MTVAFDDAVVLSGLLAGIVNRGDNLSNWEAVSDVLHQWFWERKALAPTINVLSVALYELFGASSEWIQFGRYFAQIDIHSPQTNPWTL